MGDGGRKFAQALEQAQLRETENSLKRVTSLVALGVIINDRQPPTTSAVCWNPVRDCCTRCVYCETMVCRRRQCMKFSGQLYLPRYCTVHQLGPVSVQPLIVKDWTRSFEDARNYVTAMTVCLLPLTCLMMLTTNCLGVF